MSALFSSLRGRFVLLGLATITLTGLTANQGAWAAIHEQLPPLTPDMVQTILLEEGRTSAILNNVSTTEPMAIAQWNAGLPLAPRKPPVPPSVTKPTPSKTAQVKPVQAKPKHWWQSNPQSSKLAKAGTFAALRRKTIGYCLAGVQDALDAIGIRLPRLRAAADMAKSLAQDKRFTEVSVPRKELASLPPGAIIVWHRGKGHPHGHISITQGNGKESSDHIGTIKPNMTPNYRVFVLTS